MKRRLPFRIFPLLLSFVLVFTVITIETQPAQAFAPAIPIVAGAVVCGTALVAAGLVFSEQGSFDAAVDAFMDWLPPDALTSLDYAVDNCKIMLSALTGKYFLSTVVPDTLWGAARSWVVDRFEVGSNSIVVIPAEYSGLVDTIPFMTASRQSVSLYFVVDSSDVVWSSYPQSYQVPYGYMAVFDFDYEGGTVTITEPGIQTINGDYIYAFNKDYVNRVISVGSDADRLWWHYINAQYRVDVIRSSGASIVNFQNSRMSGMKLYLEYTPSVSVDVWGDTQVGVGVDDWTWENTHTGDRSVSIPLEMDSEKSLPYVGPTNTLAVNWDDVYSQLLDADYAKVAAIEAGISVPLELADSESVAVAEGLAPGISGLNKSVNSFVPILKDFGMNLLSLYLWVPEQTRIYIGVALSISLLAVVYKIVRP